MRDVPMPTKCIFEFVTWETPEEREALVAAGKLDMAEYEALYEAWADYWNRHRPWRSAVDVPLDEMDFKLLEEHEYPLLALKQLAERASLLPQTEGEAFVRERFNIDRPEDLQWVLDKQHELRVKRLNAHLWSKAMTEEEKKGALVQYIERLKNVGRRKSGKFAPWWRLHFERCSTQTHCPYCNTNLIEKVVDNGIRKGSFSCDHLIPVMLGGREMSQNLVYSCPSCNSKKGNKDWLNWGVAVDPEAMKARRLEAFKHAVENHTTRTAEERSTEKKLLKVLHKRWANQRFACYVWMGKDYTIIGWKPGCNLPDYFRAVLDEQGKPEHVVLDSGYGAALVPKKHAYDAIWALIELNGFFRPLPPFKGAKLYNRSWRLHERKWYGPFLTWKNLRLGRHIETKYFKAKGWRRHYWNKGYVNAFEPGFYPKPQKMLSRADKLPSINWAKKLGVSSK